jgi:hypothetical protein
LIVFIKSLSQWDRRIDEEARNNANNENSVERERSRQEVEGMKAWKIRQYLPNLLWYVQERLEGGRGFLVAIRIRDVCSIDRRCCVIVQTLLARLEERGLARRYRRIPNREEGCGGGHISP